MRIERLDHVNIVTTRLPEMVTWYEEVLGFKNCITFDNWAQFKTEVGHLFLVSLAKNHLIILQHFVIQVL